MNRLIVFAVFAGVLGQQAYAQVAYPPADLSSYVTTAALTVAVPPCATPPASDTYTASAGSSTACMPRIDASRATQVQSTSVVTLSDGTFNGSFPVAFAATPSYAHAEINSTSVPYICQMGVVTTTTYSGKCFQVASTTLPGTLLALSGLVVSPIVTTTAGLTVKIIARQ